MKTGEIGNKSNGWSNGGEIDEHGGQSGFRMGGPCIEILDYFTERTPGPFVEDHLLCGASGWFPPIPPSRLMTMPLHHHLPEREPSYYRDRGWARCQIAEAQNHIFDSFGERYGLLIKLNSFLVLPIKLSRSTAVGTTLCPGGPTCSPLGGDASVGDADYAG